MMKNKRNDKFIGLLIKLKNDDKFCVTLCSKRLLNISQNERRMSFIRYGVSDSDVAELTTTSSV